MKYHDYIELKKQKLRAENRDYEKINSIVTLIAYIVRWKKVEALIVIGLILIAVIILQYLHFDFSNFKFGK